LLASADLAFADTAAGYLESAGFEVERCHDAQGVLRLTGRRPFGCVVLDLSLSEDSDMELVSYIRRQSPHTRLILLFDVHDLDRAIEGIRKGAYFYLPNTSQPSDLTLVVQNAARSLQTEATAMEYEQTELNEFVGNSRAMRRVVELISKVAPTDSTVLLLGESGTGKEVMANAVHRLSTRRDRPFIAINCAALPEQLLESEMFGYVKGAFTGADNDKRGLFEEVDGGTIFLDEVGDMALPTQAKLLRVLQSGDIRRVGASTEQRVDVRVLAATNLDLEEAVRERTFREDLYFRLNVVQIRIPPLRERLDALPTLIQHFLARSNTHFKKHVRGFDEQAEMLLAHHPYPGNIRELESIIAHAVILSDDDIIRVKDLPDQLREGMGTRLALPNHATDHIPTLEEMEAQLIRAALEKLDDNQTETAKALGISRSTLWRKMKQFGIGK
jgi:DNA-binding NtrC family response regulator